MSKVSVEFNGKLYIGEKSIVVSGNKVYIDGKLVEDTNETPLEIPVARDKGFFKKLFRRFSRE